MNWLTDFCLSRVCEFEELQMSENEAAKFVASIETEMFDIFRNTDSKYMNKYRTIMFNLKDPRNKVCLKLTEPISVVCFVLIKHLMTWISQFGFFMSKLYLKGKMKSYWVLSRACCIGLYVERSVPSDWSGWARRTCRPQKHQRQVQKKLR